MVTRNVSLLPPSKGLVQCDPQPPWKWSQQKRTGFLLCYLISVIWWKTLLSMMLVLTSIYCVTSLENRFPPLALPLVGCMWGIFFSYLDLSLFTWSKKRHEKKIKGFMYVLSQHQSTGSGSVHDCVEQAQGVNLDLAERPSWLTGADCIKMRGRRRAVSTSFATCNLHLNDEYKNISSSFNIVGYPGMFLENKIFLGSHVRMLQMDLGTCQCVSKISLPVPAALSCYFCVNKSEFKY